MADDKKFAGYVCTGCGIGERLDAGTLEQVATRDGKMQSCKQHEMLCSAEGVKMIKDDIANDTVTHVMIAACSQRAKVEAFNFTDVALTRANLREGVIWVRPDTDENTETTQEMADDYIRMACAELKSMTKPAPSGEQELNKTLLVVGGGITGMTAAIEAAIAGYPVHLVEKTGTMGGAVGGYYKVIPTRSPYAEPAENPVPAMIEAIEANDKITVHLNSSIAKTDGAPGRFNIEVATESGSSQTISVGAIIQASGWKPYDANNLPEFAYAKSADVVTNHELEALAVAAGRALEQERAVDTTASPVHVTSGALSRNPG